MADQIEFEFSLTGLSFKFKGTPSNVGLALQNGLHQSISGLMNTQRTVLLPATPALPASGPGDINPPSIDPPAHGQQANGQVSNGHPAANGHVGQESGKGKPRRQGGVSVKNLLRDLKTEGYFAEPRNMDAIRNKLKTKGHNIKPNTISGRLQEMTQKDELFRKQSDDGYIYKDSKFDESSRTTSPPDEPSV